METNDITVEILRDIRDAVRGTNARVDETNVRVDRLERRMTESELRVATALTDVKGAIDGVKQLLADRLDLRDRVDHCEHEIEAIKHRLDR